MCIIQRNNKSGDHWTLVLSDHSSSTLCPTQMRQGHAHAWNETLVSPKFLTFLIGGKKESTRPAVAQVSPVPRGHLPLEDSYWKAGDWREAQPQPGTRLPVFDARLCCSPAMTLRQVLNLSTSASSSVNWGSPWYLMWLCEVIDLIYVKQLKQYLGYRKCLITIITTTIRKIRYSIITPKKKIFSPSNLSYQRD